VIKMASVYDDSIAGRGFASATPAIGAPSVAVVPGGGGFGEGGLLSTLLLLGLLGGNGGIGNRKDCVDQASLNGLQDGLNTNAILGKLGAIEAAIPYNEAQVQLALAGLGDQLTRTITNGQIALMQGQSALQLAEATSTAAIQNNICSTAQTLLAGQAAINTNIDRTATTVVNAIRDDGNATRALITENVIQGLRDDKVILANELAEIRNERNRDRDRHGIEVTTIVNQQQAQLQFQEQRQRLDMLTNHLCGISGQIARATNSNVIVGNTGAVGTGTQTANPTNVNA
jgi:hypothetical protein